MTTKGLSIFRLPYTADPEKADPDWIEYAKSGQSASKWAREMEMDPHAGALTAVFRNEYRPAKHERPLRPEPGTRVLHAFDFGKGWPARGWFARTRYNGLRIFASMVGENIQLRPFVEQTIAYEVNLWDEIRTSNLCYVDPAGNQDKDDGMKSVEVLRTFGWSPRWRGSRIEEGIEAMADLMRYDQPDGEPMFAIDPRFNPTLCAALRGEYKRGKSGEPERVHPYIDVMDMIRYGVVNTKPAPRPRNAPPPRIALDPTSGYGRAVAPERIA